MVVALDAYSNGNAVADVDNTGILTWSDKHTRGFSRQSGEVTARRFVRAMLGPHHRIHSEFEMVRFTLQELTNAVVFGVSQAKRRMNTGRIGNYCSHINPSSLDTAKRRAIQTA